MTVGEAAKKMNVTVRTLQYYDKEGLLSPSAESEDIFPDTADFVSAHHGLTAVCIEDSHLKIGKIRRTNSDNSIGASSEMPVGEARSLKLPCRCGNLWQILP